MKKYRTPVIWLLSATTFFTASYFFFHWRNDIDLGWWVALSVIGSAALWAIVWSVEAGTVIWPNAPLIDGGIMRHHARGIGRLQTMLENVGNGRSHDAQLLHPMIQEVCEHQLARRGIDLTTAVSQGLLSDSLARYLNATNPSAPRRTQLQRFLKEIDAL